MSALPLPISLPVVGAGTPVPLLDGRWVPYANLDIAASAPALGVVADRVAEVLPWYASVHRGAGYLSQVSTALYEQARVSIADFVDARPGTDVAVITRHTTDAVNLLAGCVPGRVLVLDVEHHATLLPWRDATVVTGAADVAGTLVALRAELAAGDYALLAVTGASNVTGESLPLEGPDGLAALARAAGVRLFVDGAQLLAHRRLSLVRSGVDYVAFSGHKLYAPFGAGALVGRRDWLDAGAPYLTGGGAVASVAVTQGRPQVEWLPAPARHEGGSPNVVGAVALATACTALAGLDPVAAARREALLRDRLVSGLAAVPGVRLLRLWDDAPEAIGVVSFTLDGTDPGLLAAYLSAEHGVGVRDGRFCAHPVLTRLGAGGGAVRASLGLATTVEEIDRLITGVEAYVAGEIRGRYAASDNTWGLVDDPRPLPHLDGVTRLADTAGACVA